MALVEMGFITNDTEGAFMLNNPGAMANYIYQGIDAYFDANP